jgi:hypothetical protein
MCLKRLCIVLDRRSLLGDSEFLPPPEKVDSPSTELNCTGSTRHGDDRCAIYLRVFSVGVRFCILFIPDARAVTLHTTKHDKIPLILMRLNNILNYFFILIYIL